MNANTNNKEESILDTLLKIINLLVPLGSIIFAAYVFFSYEALQKDLVNINLQLTNKIAQIQVAKQQSARVDTDIDAHVYNIKKFNDGTFLYKVLLKFDLKNFSDLEVDVPYYVIEYYVGTPPEKANFNPIFFRVNRPGEDTSKLSTSGFIDWKLVRWEVFYSDHKVELPDPPSTEGNIIHTKGDWATGKATSGETVGFEYDYLVKAFPQQYVAFILKVKIKPLQDKIESKESQPEYRVLSKWFNLGAANRDVPL